MTELEQNVKKVLSTVNGRATVLAATKTVAPERINLIYDMGIHTIGENRVQELLEKYDALDKRFDIHFIGRLQRNKVKYIIGKVSLIHSLDSVPCRGNRPPLRGGRTCHVLSCRGQCGRRGIEGRHYSRRAAVIP